MLHFVALAGGPPVLTSPEIGRGFAQVEVQPVNALRADVPLVERDILGSCCAVRLQIPCPDALQVRVQQSKQFIFHTTSLLHIYFTTLMADVLLRQCKA
jgi:hypothetical protein